MKQFPKLTLVGKDSDDVLSGDGNVGSSGDTRRSGAVFELVGVEELQSGDRQRVQDSVQEIFPRTPLLGVARTPRAWDFRPVLACAGEESPSVVRFVGQAIASQTHIAARLREVYERLRDSSGLHSAVLGCGEYKGEMWFRRPLVESTLAHVLSNGNTLSEADVFSLCYGLGEEVHAWHERGLVHAHITSSNIWCATQGRVFLFDAGIGFSSVVASKGRTEYNLQSFAPELFQTGQSSLIAPVSSDLYGLGLVFRRLFLGLAKRSPYEGNRDLIERRVRPFLELSDAMLQSDPRQRPSLAQIRRFIADAYQEFSSTQNAEIEKKSPVDTRANSDRPKQGKIIRPNPAAGSRSQAESVSQVREPNIKAENVGPEPASAMQSPVEMKQVAPSPASNPIEPPQNPQAAPMAQPYHAQMYPPGQIPPQGAVVQTPMGPYIYGQPVVSMQPAYVYQTPPPFAPPYGMPYPGAQPQYGATYSPYPPSHVPPSQPPIGDSGSHPSQAAPVKKDGNLFGLGMLLTLLLFVFWLHRTDRLQQLISGSVKEDLAVTDYTDPNIMKQAWQSKLPSQMIPVALIALERSEQAKAAQTIIVESALKGEDGYIGVNLAMLRVAFDSAWESELGIEDRRSALAMGLAGLLRDKLPKDLARVDGLHPGVVLAATASAGKSASRILETVPASILTRLVPPYGAAFKELVRDLPNLTCGDDAVQRLARLGTRGAVDGLDDITLFLKGENGAIREDASRRLRAMAAMFAYNNSLANSLLQVLLKHPNLSIDIPSIKWAKDWDLLSWKELEAGDQLFVLAGVPPAKTISSENIGKLFAHPVDEIRGYAIGKALDRIRLSHPGAYDVLRIVQSDPSLLTPRQTVELAHLLENPEALQIAPITSWISTSPPMQIVAPLLVATAGANKGTTLDTALAIYLKENKWKPDLGVLRKLSTHPDDYTRLFAYNELYLMEDHETAREFLAAAVRKEQNVSNREQLQQMLSDLQAK